MKKYCLQNEIIRDFEFEMNFDNDLLVLRRVFEIN
jgi:hypothetical protein